MKATHGFVLRIADDMFTPRVNIILSRLLDLERHCSC